MIQQAKAKIFLADERGVNETSTFQSRHTFNFGKYFNEHKIAFGDLYVLNDDLLAGGGDIKMLVKEDSYIVLIPVAGAINYKDTDGSHHLVAAGQTKIVAAERGTMMEISNPFREEQVNFLQIWIKTEQPKIPGSTSLITYDDVNENLNSLVQAVQLDGNFDQLPFALYIGKFSGRGETVYLAKNKTAGVYAFVIQGAFEIEGRLLHAGDGLALLHSATAEMEALSNDAIIVLIELSNVPENDFI